MSAVCVVCSGTASDSAAGRWPGKSRGACRQRGTVRDICWLCIADRHWWCCEQ